MKSLVVFYSRKGSTKKIAKIISSELDCDSDEIFDTKKRKGIIGFLPAGKDATFEKLTVIEGVEKNPELYDLIILGTPIWNKRMTPAIRTYITENNSKLKNIAFFCTEGGRGGPKAFKSMTDLCEKEPLSTLEITQEDIKEELHLEKIKTFIQEIK